MTNSGPIATTISATNVKHQAEDKIVDIGHSIWESDEPHHETVIAGMLQKNWIWYQELL